MLMHSRTLTAVIPLTLVVAVVAGCTGDSGDTAGGGVLRFGDKVVDCADPHQRGNNPASYQLKPVTDSLLAQDPETREFLPWLATSHSVNAAATEFTFDLRDDVTFSDGTPLTGQAVADSLDAIVNTLGAAASLPIGYLNDYAGAEATGEHQVVVRFSQPNIAFLQGAATGNLGIVSEATSKLSAQERCANGVIGTGPFVIDAYESAEHLRYVKRPDYSWANPLAENRGAAHLDGLEIVSIRDTSVLAGSLLSNQIDAYSVVLPQDAGRIEGTGGGVHTTTNAGFPVAIIPNVDGTVFADPAVRQALQIGFDRQAVINGVIGDWFQPSTSALSSATTGYADLGAALAYDPDRARELLDGAGWQPGADGIREKDGQRLVFDVAGEFDWNESPSVLAIIREQLREVGFELNINLLPTGQSAAVFSSGDYGSRWVNGYTPEPDTLRAVLGIDAGNWARRTDRERLDDLLDQQVQEVDPQQRNAILADIQSTLIDEGYLIPIYDWAQSFAVSPDVSGVQLPYLSGPGPLYSDISLTR